MATRLFFTNTSAGFASDAGGTWDFIAPPADSTVNLKSMSTTKSGTSLNTTFGLSVGVFTTDVYRFASSPFLSAGTLSGTVSWVVGVSEGSLSANAFNRLYLFVIVGTSNVVRGVLLTEQVSGTEWPTTQAGRSGGPLTLSAVSCLAGDRIVAEVGASTNTNANYSMGMRCGGTGSDLADASTAVTTNPGWLELSGADSLFVASSAKRGVAWAL